MEVPLNKHIEWSLLRRFLFLTLNILLNLKLRAIEGRQDLQLIRDFSLVDKGFFLDHPEAGLLTNLQFFGISLQPLFNLSLSLLDDPLRVQVASSHEAHSDEGVL